MTRTTSERNEQDTERFQKECVRTCWNHKYYDETFACSCAVCIMCGHRVYRHSVDGKLEDGACRGPAGFGNCPSACRLAVW